MSRTDVITALTTLEAAARAEERERIIRDIETDPEIPIPRPYEVAWIMMKIQHAAALTPEDYPANPQV